MKNSPFRLRGNRWRRHSRYCEKIQRRQAEHQVAGRCETASAKSNSSHLNRERLEVGRALVEVTYENLDSIIPYYTGDIQYFDPVVEINGIGEMTEFLYRLFGSTPDLITTVEDEIAIDDTYTATWTMVGTFLIRDEGGNIVIGEDGQPVGLPYEASGMSIIKFHPKTTDAWYQRDYYSEADIMQAIPGLDAAACGFRFYYIFAVDPSPEFPEGCALPPPPE